MCPTTVSLWNEGKRFSNSIISSSLMVHIQVSVVKTESIGEARGLMEVMDNCDGIIVAGGDGAVCEAVTGLLRRQDSQTAVQRFPVGVIPIGKRNNIAKSIFRDYKGKLLDFMSIMSFIKIYFL